MKLSASELAEVKIGKGEEDLRCNRLLTANLHQLNYSEIFKRVAFPLLSWLSLSVGACYLGCSNSYLSRFYASAGSRIVVGKLVKKLGF